MQKHGILTGALLGGGFGLMQTKDSPELGFASGAAIGAATESALRAFSNKLLLPTMIAGGALLGRHLTPEQPMLGAAGGGLGALVLADLLSQEKGLGGALKLPQHTREALKLFPGQNIGLRFGVPLLLGAAVAYLYDRYKKERQQSPQQQLFTNRFRQGF